MSYFHIHLSVKNLAESIGFYNRLLGQNPTVEQSDYAKWQLEGPRVNFSISSRGGKKGLDHLGFQAVDESELAQLRERSDAAAGEAVIDERKAVCCYARSDKHWTLDPSGIAWEHFYSLEQVTYFGSDQPEPEDVCCSPQSCVTHACGATSCCGPSSESNSA